MPCNLPAWLHHRGRSECASRCATMVWVSTQYKWPKMLMADVVRVIAPDLRGFGKSPLTSGAVTMDTYADDLHDLLDTLGISRVVIAGLSMGGYVAFAF